MRSIASRIFKFRKFCQNHPVKIQGMKWSFTKRKLSVWACSYFSATFVLNVLISHWQNVLIRTTKISAVPLIAQTVNIIQKLIKQSSCFLYFTPSGSYENVTSKTEYLLGAYRQMSCPWCWQTIYMGLTRGHDLQTGSPLISNVFSINGVPQNQRHEIVFIYSFVADRMRKFIRKKEEDEEEESYLKEKNWNIGYCHCAIFIAFFDLIDNINYINFINIIKHTPTHTHPYIYTTTQYIHTHTQINYCHNIYVVYSFKKRYETKTKKEKNI